MVKLDRLEIGTLSFARCDSVMVISPTERVRLILAAVEAYRPTILVTAGHAVHTLKHLDRLAQAHAELKGMTTIVTEVAHDRPTPSRAETHAMYAIRPDGMVHAFGHQVFAYADDVRDTDAPDTAAFDVALPNRTLALPEWNVFALVCGEINVLRGRVSPRFISPAAEAAIMAADVVINPTHDRMSNAGTLDAKRRLLSRSGDDGRNRVYVSCSNWEACGNGKPRVQYPSPTLHTVYAAGEPCSGYDEHADGAFGFVYRHWTLDL